MNAFLIDDDIEAQENFTGMLAKYCPDIVVIGKANSYQEAVSALLQVMDKIDILFCDINLGDKTGFDVLDKLKEFRGFVVFVSAHEEFALKAYRYAPVNYLTKPVSPSELIETLDRIAKRRKDVIIPETQLLPHITIPVYIAGKWEIIETDKIVCIQAQGSYSSLFVAAVAKPYTTSRPLKYYEDKLSTDAHFVRIQKSYIINKKYIVNISRSDSTIAMLGGLIIPIGGGSYKTMVRDMIN